MKNYSVVSYGESYHTDSLEDAKSVMESMAMYYGKASVIDNESNKVIDSIEL